MYVGLILSSTLVVIGYIRRSLAQRYRATTIDAKSFVRDTVAAIKSYRLPTLTFAPVYA